MSHNSFTSVSVNGEGTRFNETNKKDRESTFVFTDERLKKHPGLKRRLAEDFNAFVGQRLEQEEAKDLLDKLTSLKSIGYSVEVKKLPTKEEMAREEGYDEGYDAGYKAARKDVKTIAAVVVPAIGVILTSVLLGGRANRMY